MTSTDPLALPRAAENDDGLHEAVEIVARAHGARTFVHVRTIRSRTVLFSIRSTDDDGAVFAVQSAERYCAERGLVLVMRARRAA